eukprot:5032386-Alexandrium_andersonii.AAC.1
MPRSCGCSPTQPYLEDGSAATPVAEAPFPIVRPCAPAGAAPPIQGRRRLTRRQLIDRREVDGAAPP